MNYENLYYVIEQLSIAGFALFTLLACIHALFGDLTIEEMKSAGYTESEILEYLDAVKVGHYEE